LLLNYQNLCPECTQWLRRDAGASLRRGAGRVYGLPNDLWLSFFPM